MVVYDELTKKQQLRYERILLLAETLIYEQGFYKLSLKELTQQLKISRSTIYENFGSKEGLVEIIVDRLNEKLDKQLQSVLEDQTLNVAEKLMAIAQRQGSILNGRQERKLIADLKIHTPHLFKKLEAGRKNREINAYQPLIEQGVKDGLFDDSLPTDFILQMYLKMAQLICDTDLLENCSLSKIDANEKVIGVFLNGTKRKK